VNLSPIAQPFLMKKDAVKPGPIRRFFNLLGPGVVTGAADDDPSGIVTYSMAGAQLGTSLLWTSLLTWPLMGAVQMMCARIGMVSGTGLAKALQKKFPKPVLLVAALSLFVANTINISADLSGMADVMQLLTGIYYRWYIVAFGFLIIFVTVRFSYQLISSILKWLAGALFAYVITAFLVHPHWPTILAATFLPTWPHTHDQWEMLVAILGTTISPYLFFCRPHRKSRRRRRRDGLRKRVGEARRSRRCGIERWTSVWARSFPT
jgi:NRAMP (natural resistance-associated macrophage protein)-like metal ion transporter